MKFFYKYLSYIVLFVVFFSIGIFTVYTLRQERMIGNKEIELKKIAIKKDEDIVLVYNNHLFNLQIADTPQSRRQGLMNREELPADTGMLFVFPEEDAHSFWMKNTLIPLDIIWINKDKKVVYINHNTPPCREDPCETYVPQEPAQYVLEINAGQADEIGLKIGDQLDFRSN